MSSGTRPVRSVVGTSRRLSAAQARARRRSARIRFAGVLVFLAVLVIACIHVASPLFQKAIREFTLPLQDSSIIVQQAQAKHVDAALVAAVIYAETGFDARTSSAGARGLMQVEPQTAEALADESGATNFHVSDLGTPAVNIAYGTYYLRELLKNFNGDEIAALAAYNGGEGNVDGWINRAHQAGHAFSVSDIPFPATRAYVTKVTQAQAQYRRKYAEQLGYS